MRQRVVIAMALALRPELIVLDEPTTALDVVVQREILQELEQLKAELGFAVIFITHDLSLLVEFSDRISIMYAGEIVETATAATLFKDPKHPYTVGLMDSFPPLTGPLERIAGIPGSPPNLAAAASRLPLQPTLPALRRRRPGALRAADERAAPAARGRARPLRRLPSRRGAGVSTAALEVQGLTKEFGRRPPLMAVDDVSFTLRPGTITALVGESGSGKSTIARILSQLYPPTDGTIRFRGKDVSRVRGRRALLAYRSEVQMIFQDPFASLNPVKTGAASHRAAAADPPARAARARSTRACASCCGRSVSCRRTRSRRSIRTSSPAASASGSRSRGRSPSNPTVVLADEPISMLDVSIRIGLLNLMAELKRDLEIAFLYITHDIASARYVADEVLVLYAGRIVEQGPTDAVLHDPQHAYTRLLLSAVPNPEGGLQLEPFVKARRPAVDGELVEVRPGHFVRQPTT